MKIDNRNGAKDVSGKDSVEEIKVDKYSNFNGIHKPTTNKLVLNEERIVNIKKIDVAEKGTQY